MQRFFLLILLSLLCTTATADWAIKGEGNFSCPDYVSAKRTNSAKLYSSISWVQGFITGVNYQAALPQGSDSFVGRDMPAASMVSWLENYCRDSPQDYLADAAEALIKDLRQSR
jgi:hypothetical protein